MRSNLELFQSPWLRLLAALRLLDALGIDPSEALSPPRPSGTADASTRALQIICDYLLAMIFKHLQTQDGIQTVSEPDRPATL